jgi:anti-sigma factor RsiW
MTNSKMTCEAFDAALPDYLEATLDDSARASVERHLSECLRCSALLRDLENIRKEASMLPDLVPSRDLWQGIEARITAPVIPLAARPERQRRFAPAWMGIAAAALVVSTAGITYTLTSRSVRSGQTKPIAQIVSPDSETQSGTTTDSGAAPNTPESVNVGGGRPQSNGSSSRIAQSDTRIRRGSPSASLASQVITDREQSEVVYGKEIDMLQKIVSQRKTQLDSATIAIIETNLQIIDAAIQQSRAALARDPASQLLGQQLTHALDKKVELLRTAVMLPAST